jgi:uncharacterized membrane protein
MNKIATGIVAYIGIIGWLIAFLAGDKEGAKFHLNQALVLNIISIVLSILSNIKFIGIIASLLSIVVLVFAIIGIVSAAKNQEKALPIIGGIKILK